MASSAQLRIIFITGKSETCVRFITNRTNAQELKQKSRAQLLTE